MATCRPRRCCSCSRTRSPTDWPDRRCCPRSAPASRQALSPSMPGCRRTEPPARGPAKRRTIDLSASLAMGEGSVLLAFVTFQRLAELALARHNTQHLRAAGAIEYGRGHYPAIVALHTAWLAGLWGLGYDRPVNGAFLMGFVMLQAARIWVVASLGRRWPTRIMVLAGEPLVRRGPYRFVRHPNYLVVALE